MKVDPETGDQQVWRQWKIVPDEDGLQEPDREILHWEAEEDYSDQGPTEIGDYVKEPLKEVNVTGRRFATDAKQVILQKLREAERTQLLNEFLANYKDVKIVTGQVKRFDKSDMIVENRPYRRSSAEKRNDPKRDLSYQRPHSRLHSQD